MESKVSLDGSNEGQIKPVPHRWGRSIAVAAAVSLSGISQLTAGESDSAAATQEVESTDRLTLDLLDDGNPMLDLLDNVKGKADSVKDWAQGVQERLDPYGVMQKHEREVGDYTLSFQPADLDIGPRWKDGGPALKLKGELLETSFAKTESLDNGWLMSQGVRGRLKGDFSTYKDPTVDLEAGVFRQYQGEIAEGYQATFAYEAGGRYRMMGPDDGFRVGVQARQKIEGGQFKMLGRNVSLYAEGRQSVGYNFGSGEMEFGYKFMAGPRYDMELDVLGQDLDVGIIVGPEIKGNQDDFFEVGLGTKVKIEF
jgi:hypothetical protein